VIGGAKFEVGKSISLFDSRLPFPVGPPTNVPYDAAADGQHFLISAPLESANVARITVFLNWPATLKR